MFATARRIRTVAVVAAFAFVASAAVAGRANAGAVTPMPASLKFADTGTGGQSASQMVTLTNTSMGFVTVDGITIGGTNPMDFVLTQNPGAVGLAPGAFVVAEVAFTPTSAGPRTGAVKVQVRGEMGTTDVSLSGIGIGPKIAVSPSPLVIGGLPFGQMVPPLAAKVQNAGGSMVTVNKLTITGPDAPRFALQNVPMLPQTLGQGKDFPIQLLFTPAAPGQAAAVLEVESTDPMTPVLKVPITGNSGDPKLSLDVGTIIFGTQRVGIETPPQDVVVSNTGLSVLNVTALTINGANAGDFRLTAVPNLPVALAVGGTTKFTVVFKPTAAGARMAAVQINSNDPKTPMRMLQMSGTGTTPLASVLPAMIDFGKLRVGQSGNQSITITNKGSGPVSVTTLKISGVSAALFTASIGAPFTVPSMSSQVVQITYKPIAVGAASAKVEIGTDDPNLPMFEVPLMGSATSPTFTLMPNKLEFGGVPVGDASAPQPFTIGNTGNVPLTVMTFQITGPLSSRYSVAPVPKPPFMINPGQMMMWNVTYKPTDASGDTVTIRMTTDDPMRTSGEITLNGYGQQADMTVQPPDGEQLDFGTVTVGMAKSLPVKISNVGDAPLILSGLSVTGMGNSNFTVDQTAPLTIQAGKTQTLLLTFMPKSGGTHEAAIEIEPALMQIQKVKIDLIGKAESPVIEVAPKMLDFGPVLLGVTSDPLELRITNRGQKTQPIDKILSDDPHFRVDTSQLERMLPPGGTTLVSVTFTPDIEAMTSGRITVLLPGNPVPVATVIATGLGLSSAGSDAGTGPGPGRGCTVGPRADGGSSALALLAACAFVLLARRRRRRA